MEALQALRNQVEPLDRDNFERLKAREFRPPYDLFGLKYLRDRAKYERDLRELYRGRAPYELLQNADDAGARCVAFVLATDGLAFVHDGAWFTVNNFRSLADGWSDKDPQVCIGHKGLGFRSVLDITPAPILIKVDASQFFAVKFTWALNNGHILETLKRTPSLRADYEDWTKYGQMVCPVMAIPGPARKDGLGKGEEIYDRSVRGQYGGQYTTMFWFPARDPDIRPAVLNEIGPIPIMADANGRKVLLHFLKHEVSVLLPFLASVKTVAVYEGDTRIGLVHLERGPDTQQAGSITVNTDIGGKSQAESFFQMRFVFPIPPQILNLPETPKAVRAMKDSGVRVVLSARLDDNQPIPDDQSRFHVYFPTGEQTGVGFTIHGDFYVMPDRTRLMSGGYNEWLLGCAAKVAANDFLSLLTQQYPARSVFSALSPTGAAITESAAKFMELFSKCLQERLTPFVPTATGPLRAREVVLPPRLDEDGFWEGHFSEVVPALIKGKEAFLAHGQDGKRTRNFLRLAGTQVLEPESLLSFIDSASQQERTPDWWYECYTYLEGDERLNRKEHAFFVGHRLLPTSDSSVASVPEDGDRVVCMPPAADIAGLRVPDVFSAVFVFLDSHLALLLEQGKDTVRSWALDRFHIARFEATELLPRAIRGVVADLFSGQKVISPAQLREVWTFMKRIVDASRGILSPRFWQEIGRFPLPLALPESGGGLDPGELVPAFLAYWPDSFAGQIACLSGIAGLRRVDESFLEELVHESGAPVEEWRAFLESAGVSATPKRLEYRRLVAREELPFTPGSPGGFAGDGFTGERQIDENRAVVQVLREEKLWDTMVGNARLCKHDIPKVLQSLALVEGLSCCARTSQDEYRDGNENWRARLWTLFRSLPIGSVEGQGSDTAFCRGGGPSGHPVEIGSYLLRQLDAFSWLPSSYGPTGRARCFSRLSSRRLISSGRTDEEIGDTLLPYVVASSIDDLAKLQHLGVEMLEDTSSPPATLLRALAIIGERLATEWGQNEILRVRARWSLVRGAIQEIYRALNQTSGAIACPPGTKFAVRTATGVTFQSPPLYYAKSGSSLEQAFREILPLFDADQPYVGLFEKIGVTRLITPETVREQFLAESNAVDAPHLRDEIANGLAPYFLAAIVARSEQARQRDLIVRRLRERFEVKVASPLTVSYSLIGGAYTDLTVDFQKFYLQRRLVPGPSVVQEAHYTLYVKGPAPTSLLDSHLDADALGETLIPAFLEGASDELAGLFPRIASRYQHLRGDPAAMEEYLYFQLGISKEAQEMATAMVAGESPPAPVSEPPPLPNVHPPKVQPGDPAQGRKSRQETRGRHQETAGEKLQNLIDGLFAGTDGEGAQGAAGAGDERPGRRGGPSPEQVDRGKRGEELIKRWLQLPGGWAGFSLVEDKREDACGYDFLCDKEGQIVSLEIKTFAPNGRIVISSNELRAAAASQDDYFIIGVLDNGGTADRWNTFMIWNPIDTLLAHGEFDIEAKLEVAPADIFDLERHL